MTRSTQEQDALTWQVGVWDRMSDIYVREIDPRFAPLVESAVSKASLSPGERVLDLGTGTGSVAKIAAGHVGSTGSVTAVDVSPEMLALAQGRLAAAGATNVEVIDGRAESIPAEDAAFDVVIASLSLMYAIDRDAAAREIARVLRPGGRFVAVTWGDPETCDIVLFQTTAGRFSGPAPAPGVGPGAMADTAPFIAQLADAAITAHATTEIFAFDFPDFETAWTILSGVTTENLSAEIRREAQDAVKAIMYPDGDGPRQFRNAAHFITGKKTR